MDKYIIEGILNERMVEVLHQSLLDQLAKASTQTVTRRVIHYLATSCSNEVVREKLMKAYDKNITLYKVSTDVAELTKIKDVEIIEYTSVTAIMSVEDLLGMKKMIEDVLNSKHLTPFTPPIDPTIIKDLISTLRAIAKTQNEHSELYRELADSLANTEVLFKENKSARHKGTVYKHVVKNTPKLNLVLKGIEFQLKMREEGRNPKSWRYC